MIPAERQRAIIALLGSEKVISFNKLADQLAVSHMTIRRDITSLEAQGKVVSVSGGVQLSETLMHEPSHDAKRSLHHGEKVAIGRKAAELIAKESCIYLDAGTTTLEVAHHISQRDDLLVVTNDFMIISFLMNNSGCELYHTGGRVDRKNKSCVGDKAARMLKSINIDLAFVSTSSWDQRGITTPSEDKVLVKQAIVNAALKSVLVSDSSKYGRMATFNAIALERFDSIISDSSLSETGCIEVQKRGITLHLAEV
ncbi:DeoR/GlpR family DNA-binding transcription regulator [Endozoicomonas sp. SCSIO W0465]|uniref:DeoR/GlpR family DNA-binding transcription regulator n=1 Tax=Endozoicomonas sp. SCSIO W0465 TaxID=2918516 RepID=UPI002075F803|nr:DeoR/GlpR family DNA-binding transcription regulator [Endozoicomonas sp. SCSIO W0465]USE36209.1 DeoR/GlpR family DNA-binding transcription regulator [Endozoicomonas sp. SCSIO W0465]